VNLSELSKHAVFVYTGRIEDELIGECIEWVLEHQHLPEITIMLATNGGSFTMTMALYDIIQSSACPVNIVATGSCMSGGAILLLAAEPNRRFAFPNASFMMHALTISGDKDSQAHRCDLPRPPADVIREMSVALGVELSGGYDDTERVLELFVERTKMTRGEAQELFSGDTHFAVKRALAMGLVTHIVSPARGERSTTPQRRRWRFGRRKQ